MPTETFRSKVDTWVVVVIGAAAILVSIAVGSAARVGEMSLLAAVAVVVLAIALPAWMLATTRYELADQCLLVRSGPLRWRIAILGIRSVTPTRSPLSSPALSLDRLRIEYGTGRVVMISPIEKDEFVRALDARRNRPRPTMTEVDVTDVVRLRS